jgi:hypothetical protein
MTALLPQECGEQIIDDNIVGGSIAAMGEYPWLAGLEYITCKLL